MRACWLKWVGRDWSISADYIWLNYSGANNARHREQRIGMQVFSGAHEMSDSGSTRFSFQYYADANYSTLHNLRVRLALQDMYID